MKFIDLVDIIQLQKLCESFTEFCGAVIAVVDIDGSVIISSGWRDICTKFHRVNPQTAARCKESDTELARKLKDNHTYNVYRCKNGLIDVAVPIIVGNEHIANFFTGQFFFEKPDRDFFIRYADEFKFDKTEYLNALDRVPVMTEDEVTKMTVFLSNLVKMIGESGLARKGIEAIREQLIKELNDSAVEIKTLSGLLPICSSCKKIRNEEGFWEQIETYVSNHSDADFSHSMCPACAKKLYPEIF